MNKPIALYFLLSHTNIAQVSKCNLTNETHVIIGNRILSYGGSLSLRQEFRSNDYGAVSEPGTDVVLVGDDVSIYWTNPNRINAAESLVCVLYTNLSN